MRPTELEQPPLYSSLSLQPVLCEMVELFVAEMPARVGRMQAYFDRADWDGLRRAAHQIRGVAASYGFHVLVPYAARLAAHLELATPIGKRRVRRWAELVGQCRRVSTR